MNAHDELKHGDTRYLLADPGRSYLAYADNLRGELGVKSLPAGKCDITWLDCLTGASLTEEHVLPAAGDHGFRKPPAFGPECAAWFRFPGVALRRAAEPAIASAPAATSSAGNKPPLVEAQNYTTRPGASVYIQLAFTDSDGPGPYAYTLVSGHSMARSPGDNNDRTYTPAAGFTGRDQFTWRVNDGAADSTSPP